MTGGWLTTAGLPFVPASVVSTLDCFRQHWEAILGAVLFGVLVALLLSVLKWAVQKYLDPKMEKVGFGGLWISASLCVLLIYLIILGIAVFSARSSVEALFLKYTGVAALFPGLFKCLQVDAGKVFAAATPLYFFALYAMIHMIHVVLAFLLLWGIVGRERAFAKPPEEKEQDSTDKQEKKKENAKGEKEETAKSPAPVYGPAPLPVGPLAPYMGPIFQLFGYWEDLRFLEERHRAYFDGLVFALRIAKWVTLPAAFLGTLPAALWIVGALLVDSLHRNLKELSRPAKEKAAEAAKEEEVVEPEQKAVSLMDVVRAVVTTDAESRFEMRSVATDPSRPARLTTASLLSDGPAMELISERLSLEGNLYAHQQACDSRLRQGENVLLATAPLSGRTTVGDLLALHRVLTEGQSVLYICPTPQKTAERMAALQAVALKADWDWHLYVWDLSNPSKRSLDLQMRQPSVLFSTPRSLHELLMPNARRWDFFLRSLGLTVVTDLESYTGAEGANFYRLSRRLAKLCDRYGSEPRCFCTVRPYSVDVRAFAERLLGVKLSYVGPGTDTAPQPSREIMTCRPLASEERVARTGDDIPVPVLVAGRIAGLGHHAELYGFEQTLTREERDRIDEVLLQHGKARLDPARRQVSSGAGAESPGRRAEVVVAEATASDIRLMPELTRHFGADLVEVSVKLDTHAGGISPELAPRGFAAMEASLGMDEAAFEMRPARRAAAERKAEEAEKKSKAEEKAEAKQVEIKETKEAKEKKETTEPEESVEPPSGAEGAEQTDDSPDGQPAETSEEDVREGQVTAATMILPSEEPFVHLLVSQGLVGGADLHPYMRLGCELATYPENVEARRKNLRCAMAETAWRYDDLVREFGSDLTEFEFDEMDKQGRLVRRTRREVSQVTGLVESVELLRYVGHPLPHAGTSMDTVGEDFLTVLDRHTRHALTVLDRVRGLADAYPGLVFMADGRRYRVCQPDDQTGLQDGFIYADPCERAVITSKVRELVLEETEPERRRSDRRKSPDGSPAPIGVAKPPSDRPQNSAALSAVLGDAGPGAVKSPRPSPLEGAPSKAGRPGEGVSDRRAGDRRSPMLHSIGGSEFMLWHPWVYLHEWIKGVKTYNRSSILLDATYYTVPIETRYRTRAAVLSFHQAGRDASEKVLHSLVHLFSHVLPAFVFHRPFDLDIEYMHRFGPDHLPSIAFIDRHPGGGGFAQAVNTEVFKHLCYWGYRLLTDCPAGCKTTWGCMSCLRSLQCHAEHGEAETDLDREGALQLLEQLMGGFAK